MADHFLFPLDAAGDWALCFDDCQWIVASARNRRAQTYWHPRAFIASEKRVLLRVAREIGIQLSPEAVANLDAMPERFLEWRDGLTIREAA